MKKIMILVFSLAFVISAYSQNIEKKENIEKGKKIEQKGESEEVKQGRKILNEIKEDLNESLELKVLRSKNNLNARVEAADKAFDVGADRLEFLRNEEMEIIKFGKEAGIKNKDKFLGQQFDEAHKAFEENKNKIASINAENEKLKEYLKKLETMENKIK